MMRLVKKERRGSSSGGGFLTNSCFTCTPYLSANEALSIALISGFGGGNGDDDSVAAFAVSVAAVVVEDREVDEPTRLLVEISRKRFAAAVVAVLREQRQEEMANAMTAERKSTSKTDEDEDGFLPESRVGGLDNSPRAFLSPVHVR
jgi:hypothetical protein